MKKVIRLTESDLARIIKQVIKEQTTTNPPDISQCLNFEQAMKIDACRKAVNALTKKEIDPVSGFECGMRLGAQGLEFIKCVTEKLKSSSTWYSVLI